jgi:hypothetical protein
VDVAKILAAWQVESDSRVVPQESGDRLPSDDAQGMSLRGKEVPAMSWLWKRSWALLLCSATLVAVTGHVAANELVEELRDRYRRSYIEIHNARQAGQPFGIGAVLVVAADEIRANPFRISQLNPKAPHVHAGDFARVEIGERSQLTTSSGSVSLPRGTRLVIIDLMVDTDRVRLFTHTLKSVDTVNGGPLYGCTEFVFRFAPSVLDRKDVQTIEERIDEWIPLLERRG